MNPIDQAISPLKKDAIERAEQEALKRVEWVKKELSAVGNDLQVCAPYPKSGEPGYANKMIRYRLFRLLSKSRQCSRRLSDPDFADVNDIMVERYVENAKETAALQYDAFVGKMVSKIGHVEKAELIGNHVWSSSILTVTKEDGTKQNWKTQMIVNVSKLGKLFNQWPSRKVK